MNLTKLVLWFTVSISTFILSELWLLLDDTIENQAQPAKKGPVALWRALKARFSVESAAIEILRASSVLADNRRINMSEVREFLGMTFGAVSTLSRHSQTFLIST